MRKLFIGAVFVMLFLACKPKKNEALPVNDLFVSSFKVIGLNDSLIADSVWRIAFKPGIESVYLSVSDSTVSIKADKEITSPSEIKKEIMRRGVEIIESF